MDAIWNNFGTEWVRNTMSDLCGRGVRIVCVCDLTGPKGAHTQIGHLGHTNLTGYLAPIWCEFQITMSDLKCSSSRTFKGSQKWPDASGFVTIEGSVLTPLALFWVTFLWNVFPKSI